jgi:hypothetical protein
MKVSQEWIDYAHTPPAESGNASSKALCDKVTGYTGSVDVTEPELIRELMSVAQLYEYGSHVNEPDQPLWWRAYPKKLIARCRAALGE